MKSLSHLCRTLALFLPVANLCAQAAAPTLETGYTRLYNLDFAGAHAIFQQWQQLHPEDPVGPASEAGTYLFSELDRLHILESDFFTDDANFTRRQKSVPDLAVRKLFDDSVEKAQRLIDQALARSPNDNNATFAQILIDSSRGDYAALIEKRNLQGLGYLKSGRLHAEALLARDPNCYDAYLAVGIENYLLGLNAAPLRWLLRMTGAQTDKQLGIAKVRVTAEKGHYMAPFARVLLAVAALRDKDRATAKSLLQALAADYPQNRLYVYELGRLQ